jgi:hypothetical protein
MVRYNFFRGNVMLAAPTLLGKPMIIGLAGVSGKGKRIVTRVVPHIWGNICAFPHILESPSSYMTLQLLHSEFPYI